LFEFLILEGAQAGLMWQTVLNKRENYRRAFSGFDARKIARYGAKDVERLLNNPGIIRNRLKVAATIQNAKAFLEVQKVFGSFDTYIWQFVGYKTINHKIKTMKDIPATTKESDALSKVYSVTLDEDIHTALKTMRHEKIRRLPIVNHDGMLQGILSLNDIALRAEEEEGRRHLELTYEGAMITFKAICQHRPARQAAA